MPKDIREYLDYLRYHHPEELVTVDREVDPSWEIAAVLRRLQADNKFPAVLFNKVHGSKYPVISNLFASRVRLAAALGVSKDDMLTEYSKRVIKPLKSEKVSSGPVKEIIKKGDEVDLRELPIATHCEKDVGAYITAGVTVTRDPETRHLNVGIFRMMYAGPRKLIVHLSPEMHAAMHYRMAEAEGRDLDVAVAIGYHPTLAIGSQLRVPAGADKMAVCGGLLGEPIQLVKCETNDLEVPAYAEIVLEGKFKAHLREHDAPFGEFAWYYGPERDDSKVFEITAMTMRKNAIYHDLFNAHLDHSYAGLLGREGSLYTRIKPIAPQVTRVAVSEAGVCRFIAYVQVKKVIEGTPKNVALLALGSDPTIKIAIVVDEDIDITSDREVLWAVVTRARPDKDFFFIPNTYIGLLDPVGHKLDFPYEKDGIDTKVGIDATIPLGVPFEEKADVAKEKWEKIDLAKYLTEQVSMAYVRTGKSS